MSTEMQSMITVVGTQEHTRAERETLASLRHPFVVRLRYAFQSRDRLYLVTDFYAGGSLERHLDDAHPAEDPRGRDFVCVDF